MNTVAVIPSRYGSSRFPGKPLADIAGRPMIWHVYQRARLAEGIAEVVVATDDRRIAEACDEFGIPNRMTGPAACGTDRVAEVARSLPADAYLNIQGDEPLFDVEILQRVVAAMRDGATAVATGSPVTDVRDVLSCDVVKVVPRSDGGLLYMSRQPLPYPKSDAPVRYFRQVGIYGFGPAELEKFNQLPQGEAEAAEGIELLRFLEYGVPVTLLDVPYTGFSVDSPADLERARVAAATDELTQRLLAAAS